MWCCLYLIGTYTIRLRSTDPNKTNDPGQLFEPQFPPGMADPNDSAGSSATPTGDISEDNVQSSALTVEATPSSGSEAQTTATPDNNVSDVVDDGDDDDDSTVYTTDEEEVRTTFAYSPHHSLDCHYILNLRVMNPI